MTSGTEPTVEGEERGWCVACREVVRLNSAGGHTIHGTVPDNCGPVRGIEELVELVERTEVSLEGTMAALNDIKGLSHGNWLSAARYIATQALANISVPIPTYKSSECTCRWVFRRDMGRLYGISMGSGWLRQSDAPDCPEHANGRSHGGFESE